MSSSSTDNADSKATRAADEEDGNSIEDTAAKQQLKLQIEDLSIKNKQGDTPTSTNTAENTDNIITCAACGNEGEKNNMNICNKCKMVYYCNAACKKKHKSKHKKKCDRRVAELHDEELFREPPTREECLICFLPLPHNPRESSFKSCCGKIICGGCIHAMAMEEIRKGKKKEEWGMCAFCRTPPHSSNEEGTERRAKLMDNGNADAFDVQAGHYANGTDGMPQDWVKANELLLKAGELGCAAAYSRLGNSYDAGRGMEVDKKKAKHYYELAAMRGDVHARHNLGCNEYNAGNYHRAYKHYMVAARAGFTQSLDQVKMGFMDGDVTKDEYAGTLRAFHERQSEMKSEARDAAFKALRAAEGS